MCALVLKAIVLSAYITTNAGTAIEATIPVGIAVHRNSKYTTALVLICLARRWKNVLLKIRNIVLSMYDTKTTTKKITAHTSKCNPWANKPNSVTGSGNLNT